MYENKEHLYLDKVRVGLYLVIKAADTKEKQEALKVRLKGHS